MSDPNFLGMVVVNDRCVHGGSMMTSSNGNIFRATVPLWGEFTGDRWIPLTKARYVKLWSAPEHTVEHTIETPVI